MKAFLCRIWHFHDYKSSMSRSYWIYFGIDHTELRQQEIREFRINMKAYVKLVLSFLQTTTCRRTSSGECNRHLYTVQYLRYRISGIITHCSFSVHWVSVKFRTDLKERLEYSLRQSKWFVYLQQDFLTMNVVKCFLQKYPSWNEFRYIDSTWLNSVRIWE